ncbi:MAG: OmpA family protein [Panacagrimonas sp.]
MHRFLLPTLLVAGCATTHDRIVLLPDAQGKVGKIMVIQGDQETLMDQAYASMRTDDRGGAEPTLLDPATIHADFAAELASLPPRPVSYFLYFVSDSPVLTAESRERLLVILKEIDKRPAAEVVVIGHTDTRGTHADNDQLSVDRAAVVHDEILKLQNHPSQISIAGRGERELAVPTGEGVDEPCNRRVEINVR